MYVKPKGKRLPASKRKWVGGAMAAVGMVTSIIGKAQEAKKQAKALEDQQATARMNLLVQDRQAEAGITSEQDALYGLGNTDSDLYANGGNLGFVTPRNLSQPNQSDSSQSSNNMPTRKLSHKSEQVLSQRAKLGQSKMPSQTGFASVGGTMEGIAKGTDVAKGNTHTSKEIDNSYGITLNDGNQDIAEVEDKEVVKHDVVYSDRLKYKGNQTYASKAESLAKKRGKLEKDLDGITDIRRRNSLERQISIVDGQENALYVDQEMSKLKQGAKGIGTEAPTEADLSTLPLSGEPTEYAEGGKFWDSNSEGFNFDKAMNYAGQALPIVDNLYNAFRKTPELPTPLIAPLTTLNTDVNVEPQLASVRRTVSASTRNILDNSNNSQVARNAITNARLKGSAMEGEIKATRDNAVRGIENQNVQMINQKTASDTAAANNKAMLDYQRQVGIGDRKSGNMANFVDDVKGIVTAGKLQKNFDESTVSSISSDKTGATLRSYLNNPYFVSELRRNPQMKARLEQLAITQDKDAWDRIFGAERAEGLEMTKAGLQLGNPNSINQSWNTIFNKPAVSTMDMIKSPLDLVKPR